VKKHVVVFVASLSVAVWYFSPDGQVYQNLRDGFSKEDLAAHKGRKGTFKVAGGELAVTWADGKTTRAKFSPDKTGFGGDAGIFTPVKPIDDPKKIAGTHEGDESVGGGTANWAAASKTLTLKPDGTVRRSIAFPCDDGKTPVYPDRLYVGGTMFKRQ
jgi:hypothetical protein